MDERDQAAEDDAREAGALLFIGLIVLLIGFFIVLNRASTIEGARSRAVMGSVAAAFATGPADANRMHAFTADLGDVLADAALRGRVGKLVATDFPLVKVSEVAAGEVYRVDLPVTSLWVGASETPTDAGRRFAAKLAGLLAAPPRHIAYRLSAWLDDAGNGVERTRAIRRAAGFADALVAAGAPAAAVDTGLARVPKTVLRLLFSRRTDAEAGR